MAYSNLTQVYYRVHDENLTFSKLAHVYKERDPYKHLSNAERELKTIVAYSRIEGEGLTNRERAAVTRKVMSLTSSIKSLAMDTIPDNNFPNWDPKTILETLYTSRDDLQEAFPEAANGDYARLMRWAASLRLGSDPAANSLEQYQHYFQYTADILEQAKAIAQKDQRITELLESKSWKATAPLREVAREFKRVAEYIDKSNR